MTAQTYQLTCRPIVMMIIYTNVLDFHSPWKMLSSFLIFLEFSSLNTCTIWKPVTWYHHLTNAYMNSRTCSANNARAFFLLTKNLVSCLNCLQELFQQSIASITACHALYHLAPTKWSTSMSANCNYKDVTRLLQIYVQGLNISLGLGRLSRHKHKDWCQSCISMMKTTLQFQIGSMNLFQDILAGS